MIFKPVLAAKVMSGEKTETRRPWKGETLCRYRPEHDYAVQPGRGKHQIGRLYVTEVERVVLDTLTDEDAVREGFGDREAFEAYWRALYDGRWDPMAYVWRIRFHVCAAPCANCGLIASRRFNIDPNVPTFWACDTEHAHLFLNPM